MGFFFILGLAIGILFRVWFPTDTNDSYKQLRTGGYEYINPLVDFESIESAKIGELSKMEKDLNGFVNNKIENYEDTNVSHISIYYKDLNSGAWIGINENEGFSPASLLKLPIMIAVYKIAESDSDFLNKNILYLKDDSDSEQNIKPEENLEEGKTYTMEELVERLIKYSDNSAVDLIINEIPTNQLEKIYSDLGIAIPNGNDLEYTLSVKEYASFFRVLYNASYLNKDMSSKALKLLSEAEFDEGIVAGVPEGIKVASKFGEREFTKNPTNIKKQLHECGIVYHPTNPYILCIMTKGSDLISLEKVIQDISSKIYNAINEE